MLLLLLQSLAYYCIGISVLRRCKRLCIVETMREVVATGRELLLSPRPFALRCTRGHKKVDYNLQSSKAVYVVAHGGGVCTRDERLLIIQYQPCVHFDLCSRADSLSHSLGIAALTF